MIDVRLRQKAILSMVENLNRTWRLCGSDRNSSTPGSRKGICARLGCAPALSF